MMDLITRQRRDAKSRRIRSVRPALEGLEDRLLLYAVNGDVFKYGSRITWSIMPDGTSLGGGVTSNLVSTLDNRLGSESGWIVAFEDAFAEWAVYGNYNFVKVGDDGSAENTGNYQQSAPNFGDIRIGGYVQAANILAYTLLPPSSNGGSAAGDIFFNTNILWNIGSDYDLESVALHEIGHDVGLGESSDPNAAMYTYYNGVQQTLGSDDIAGVQSIWGPRAEDGLAVGNSNFTSAKAASITPFIDNADDQIILPNQDVTSSAQSYWFKVTTPSNASNNLTVQIQSTYLSELSPEVQIYNSNLQGLVQVSATTNAYGAIIHASISNATPDTMYYIRVLSTNNGTTGAGAYGMTVDMGTSAVALVNPPNTTVYAQSDQGGGGQYQLSGGTAPAIGRPVAAGIQALASPGDDLLRSPTEASSAPSSTSPIASAINAGGASLGGFLTSLVVSVADPSVQSGLVSSTSIPSDQGLLGPGPSRENATAHRPTVLIAVPRPSYGPSGRN